MRKRKILAKIIAITFAFVVLLSCAGIFSIEKVEVSYAVSNSNVQSVQSMLNEYRGKNLLFLNEKDVINTLKSKPYLEVESVQKKYPNVLSIKIQERRETYRIEHDGKTYILDEDGVALNSTGEISQGGNVIDLTFIPFRNSPEFPLRKIKITDILLGQKIKTSNDKTVIETFEIAKQFGLFDCIKSVTVEDATGGQYDVSFETHTGVKIYIEDVLVDGQRKGQVGLEAYNNLANDYQKRFGLLETRYVYTKTGVVEKLKVVHTHDDIDANNRNDFTLYEEIIQN